MYYLNNFLLINCIKFNNIMKIIFWKNSVTSSKDLSYLYNLVEELILNVLNLYT